MSQPQTSAPSSAQPNSARLLALGTCALLVVAGALLWMREGEKLFTDGLMAALINCF